MADQKPAKTRELTKRQTQQAKKPKKNQSNIRLENNQRLAYPRIRREAEHKSLGGSPEKTAKKPGRNYTHTKILLIYPRTLVNPQIHARY